MRAQPQNTILIAEDSADDTFFIRYAFSQTDVQCQLRFVTDGQAVLDYLDGKPPYNDRVAFPMPKLLILDIKMPRLNGFEVLEWLQKRFHDLPAVVHSASALTEDQERAVKLGARAYYVKTEKPSNLLGMFQQLCQQWFEQASEPAGETSAQPNYPPVN